MDTNCRLVEAWTKAFSRFPEAEVLQADILAVAKHCMVSPANSYGFMDGGIDAIYCQFFGAQIERTVMSAIERRPDGILPVGESMVVKTGIQMLQEKSRLTPSN